MSEPDRFDAQARELVARWYGPPLSRESVPWLAAALRAEHASALERAAQEYDKRAACAIDNLQACRFRIVARELRALIPPAAAPAADYDPITAPIPEGDMNGPHGPIRTMSDEEARRLSTFDAQLAKAGCSPAAETGKTQGPEAPDPERDRNRHNAMLVEAWREEFNQLCAALYPGNDGLIGWNHIHAKIAELLAARAAPPQEPPAP